MSTMHETARPTSPWTTGPRAPVSEELTALDVQVTGVIPSELDGRLLRNGPNPVGVVDPLSHHWFTGTGMVHGLRLRDGRAEWYRNRWVRTPDVTDVLGEPRCRSPFGDDVRLFAANTNVIGHAGRTFAVVEAGTPPVELTDELDTVGPSDFDGTRDHPYTAHPKLDPATGELHSMSYFWAWGNRVRYEVVGVDGRVRHRADIATNGPVMVHDVSITERYAVIYDLPVLFNLDAAMGGAALPYRWDSSYQARLGFVPLGGSADQVRWVDIEPCWVFHPANAYDDADGRVVLDVVRYDTMFNVDVTGPNDGPARLERWTVDPNTGAFSSVVIDERNQEFPRVDERSVGRRHRYAYTAEIGDHFDPGAALRHDLKSGITERRAAGDGRGFGELVFVPRSPDSAEDDGWLLAVAHDLAGGRADVVILDASDFSGDPVATVHLPGPVALGFHGNWVPAVTQ
jgi:carotenoid cleavage oxygenase